ncbi:PA0069 family radical SAM protein [Nitrogeniibacter aestuarii]|uniref:PA0069 family radical SAM protein n=1 Tax=Nitrogeniibacter aestuarii TaxID=2815343 RepID=UPI001D12F244|nr:PA0069 family radical SAM protein [Nitrogeniibacter aestuarii]
MDTVPLHPVPPGRGSASNQASRYVEWDRTPADDGWTDEPPERRRTLVSPDAPRAVITRNQSPDVPFECSINPYRGCEHGCAYCFARPTHAWLGLSPGLDFETRLSAKYGAADRLITELRHPGYRCSVIALGVNTDAYQPVERSLRITRGVLEVLESCHHPVIIITKGALIERDIDLLAAMAHENLVHVMVSLTTLNAPLARALEPRAASPVRRLEIIKTLSGAGVPVGALIAPVIPGLTDHELESLVASAADAGARNAGYSTLRLPLEVATLFQAWLEAHQPDRAQRVMSLVRQLRGGRENDARFGHRMRGQGPIADLYRQRFALALKRHNVAPRSLDLDTGRFRPPQQPGDQLTLL